MVNPLRRYSNPKYICTKQQIYKTCEVKTDRTEMINRQNPVIVGKFYILLSTTYRLGNRSKYKS